MTMGNVKLEFPADALRDLIAEVVKKVFNQRERDKALFAAHLAFGEPTAAALPGLTSNQLAIQKRRRQICHSNSPRRQILYARRDLLGHLASRRSGRLAIAHCEVKLPK
jgi:hypothetical protein